mmetsp:Transcript_9167/g.19680  ORF Transcript_9167/g.19680 Transcript_9167/m.19680 type:complete len:87 (+) Transcript_9167:141-401(+)
MSQASSNLPNSMNTRIKPAGSAALREFSTPDTLCCANKPPVELESTPSVLPNMQRFFSQIGKSNSPPVEMRNARATLLESPWQLFA